MLEKCYRNINLPPLRKVLPTSMRFLRTVAHRSGGFPLGATMGEIWKQIPGWEGFYEASSDGRVRSVVRTVPDARNGCRTVAGKILKASIADPEKGNYSVVSLFRNSSGMWRCVHKLVAITFLPNPNNLPEVDHKDGVKAHNNVENLEWVTLLENRRRAWANGLYDKMRYAGERSNTAKLTKEEVKEVRRLFDSREVTNQSALARKYNVAPTTIRSIVLRLAWCEDHQVPKEIYAKQLDLI